MIYRVWLEDDPQRAGGWRFYAALQSERSEAMAPGRLAIIDRIRATDAAIDIVDRLYAIDLDSGWPRDDALWESVCFLWECAVTGHSPDDPAPLTPDELLLVRLALL